VKYISFEVSTSKEDDTWEVGPKAFPGGPWEPEGGVTLIFVFHLQLDIAQALFGITRVLDLVKADWLIPVSVPTGDWALDLDKLKGEFPDLLAPLEWLRGQVIITPEYEQEQQGGLPPQIREHIKDPPSPRFVTRVLFSITAPKLISGKYTGVMGKIGQRGCSQDQVKKRLSRPSLEDMSAGPPRLVPVDLNSADVSPELKEWAAKQKIQARFPAPPSFKAELGEYTLRFIWNRMYARPQQETFHEFIVSILMQALGKKWWDAQVQMEIEEQHTVMRWYSALWDLVQSGAPPEVKNGERFELTATGEVQELLVLADDVYRLQLVRRLPHKLVERLRSHDRFQGARYEIAIAAILVRCGFEIEWVEEKTKKHCEFIAIHKVSGESVAVETKSRHRPGVLNQDGPAPDHTSLRADAFRLFKQALEQNPGDKPFAIFIDINLPHQPEALGLEKTWTKEIQGMLKQSPGDTSDVPAPYTCLFITNFAWHYGGRNVSTPGEILFYAPVWSRHQLKDRTTFDAIFYAVNNYGSTPTDD